MLVKSVSSLCQTGLRTTVRAPKATSHRGEHRERDGSERRRSSGPHRRSTPRAIRQKPADGRYARRSAKMVPVGKSRFEVGRAAIARKRKPSAGGSMPRATAGDRGRHERRGEQRGAPRQRDPAPRRPDRPGRFVRGEPQRQNEAAEHPEEQDAGVRGPDEGRQRRKSILELEDAGVARPSALRRGRAPGSRRRPPSVDGRARVERRAPGEARSQTGPRGRHAPRQARARKSSAGATAALSFVRLASEIAQDRERQRDPPPPRPRRRNAERAGENRERSAAACVSPRPTRLVTAST